jgi:hypothetical protein
MCGNVRASCILFEVFFAMIPTLVAQGGLLHGWVFGSALAEQNGAIKNLRTGSVCDVGEEQCVEVHSAQIHVPDFGLCEGLGEG